MGLSVQLLVLAEPPKLQQFYVCRLRERGYRVDAAGSIQSGVVAAIVLRPRLIIAEWLIQGGHGVELVHQLRSVAAVAAIPILFLIDEATLPLTVHQAEGGRIEYLTKPVPFERLREKVEALLHGASGASSGVNGTSDRRQAASAMPHAASQGAPGSRPTPADGVGASTGGERSVIEELMKRGLLKPSDWPPGALARQVLKQDPTPHPKGPA